MSTRIPRSNIKKIAFAAGSLCLAATTCVSAHDNNDDNDLGPFTVGDHGVLYMGGVYDVAPSAGMPTTMSGQMHVFYQLPVSPNNHSWSWKRDGRLPIIMIHGS